MFYINILSVLKVRDSALMKRMKYDFASEAKQSLHLMPKISTENNHFILESEFF